MKSVTATFKVEELIKKSRFIGVIFPAASEPCIFQKLQDLQQHHPGASHIAFAYRILNDEGFISRFFDAGEPSGTAGKPIYQHIEGKNLINTAIAVIRYFGGVKLGAGGLSRAYGNTAGAVIEVAQFLDYIKMSKLGLNLDYSQLHDFEHFLKLHFGRVLRQEFQQQIYIEMEVPETEARVFEHRYQARSL